MSTLYFWSIWCYFNGQKSCFSFKSKNISKWPQNLWTVVYIYTLCHYTVIALILYLDYSMYSILHHKIQWPTCQLAACKLLENSRQPLYSVFTKPQLLHMQRQKVYQSSWIFWQIILTCSHLHVLGETEFWWCFCTMTHSCFSSLSFLSLI